MGPFHGEIAVSSVTRCRCRRRRRCCCCEHRFHVAIHQTSLLSHAACAARRLRYSYAGGVYAGGVRRDTSDTWWMVMRRAAARSGEWAQHFSNASCFVLRKWCTSRNQILHEDKDQHVLLVGGPKIRPITRFSVQYLVFVFFFLLLPFLSFAIRPNLTGECRLLFASWLVDILTPSIWRKLASTGTPQHPVHPVHPVHPSTTRTRRWRWSSSAEHWSPSETACHQLW